jgi:hypothetical protein
MGPDDRVQVVPLHSATAQRPPEKPAIRKQAILDVEPQFAMLIEYFTLQL